MRPSHFPFAGTHLESALERKMHQIQEENILAKVWCRTSGVTLLCTRSTTIWPSSQTKHPLFAQVGQSTDVFVHNHSRCRASCGSHAYFFHRGGIYVADYVSMSSHESNASASGDSTGTPDTTDSLASSEVTQETTPPPKRQRGTGQARSRS